MTFSIRQFRANFKDNGARPNQFEVTMPAPTILGGSAPSSLPFMVMGAQIPTVQIGSVDVPYFGYKIKVQGDRVYDDWQVTVINDESFDVHSFFRNWIEAIRSPNGDVESAGAGAASGSNFYVDAIVTQYSKAGQPQHRWKFFNMFPVNVSAIDLNWNSNDVVEEFAVTLRYDWNEKIS